MKKELLIVLMLLLSLIGCKKEDPDWEAAQVKDVRIEPAAITAYVTARFEYAEKHELFFEYSDYDDMMYAHRYPMVDDGDGSFHTTVYNLEGSHDYYYRFVAKSRHGTKETGISKFTTVELFTPTITTKPVSNVTVFSGTSGGDISFDGGAPVKSRGICWGLQTNPTLNDSVILCEEGSGSFTAIIAGLTPETTYYVRAFATNKAGTAYGQEESFTTDRMSVPEVVTGNITNINYTWAIGGGEVTYAGGLLVTERGICWSEHPQPTLEDNHGNMGIGEGVFRCSMGPLFPNTTYYVRAYANNALGLVYGDDVSFTTLTVPDPPEGALSGIFSVANRRQVWFSQGNLQYRAIDSLWRFAENQYDMVGEDNRYIDTLNEKWIDLFGWGTSGWPANAVDCYMPYSYSTYQYYYHTGGSLNSGLLGDNANADWGVYNAISNGGNSPRLWRTLTDEEWKYLLGARHTLEGIRYAKAVVNDVKGLLVLPDDWQNSIFPLNDYNISSASYPSNIIDASTWEVLRDAGVLFLPAAGQRNNTVPSQINTGGFYWSSKGNNYSNGAYRLYFSNSSLSSADVGIESQGHSVRLVRNIP